jgi:hypothetical protein
MTISINGHRAGLLDFARIAWENALRRRQNKPTMPNVYHPNRTQRVIQRAYEDALYMAALHLGGLSISRAQMGAVGMPPARWYYARALLIMARLIDGSHIAERDETKIRTRLETAFRRALAHPDAFYARVPRSIRRKNHRRF